MATPVAARSARARTAPRARSTTSSASCSTSCRAGSRSSRGRTPRSPSRPASPRTRSSRCVEQLLDDRIIRQVTPIYDTRALGYGSMLVAAKVDSRAPVAGREDHQRAPRRQPQLPAQPRVQHVVHDRRRGGLQARPAGHARRARRSSPAPSRSASCRRSSCSRSAWTSRWRAAPSSSPSHGRGRRSRVELEQAALRRLRHRRHPRDAGRHAGRPRAVRARRRRARHQPGRSCSSTWPACASAASCAASRRSSSTAAPASRANGMGVWKVPEDRIAEIGPRMAAFRGISHCYQRPTYQDWPYQIFTMAHGRSKEECDAILDAIASRDRLHRGPRDAVLLDRVQEDPAPVLHGRLQELGSASTRASERGRLAPRHPVRRALRPRARSTCPAASNSPVRAMRAIGRDPLFVDRAEGAELHRRRRQPLRRLDVLVGPADPRPRAPGDPRGGQRRGRARHDVRRRRPPARSSSPRRSRARMPAVEMLRMTSSGTEATMSAIRLARAATGREKILKFAGAYHGHVDGLLAEAGSGLATQGIPRQPGRHRGGDAATRSIVPWNDAEARRAPRAPSTSSPRSSPSRIRPTWASSRPTTGFLELPARAARPATARCWSSTRSSPASASRRGGAQELTGVTPDLTILGKIIGGGLPAAAYGGRRDADGADRAGRRRLPGGHAEREPARGRRRAGDAGAARRRGLPAPGARRPSALADGPARGGRRRARSRSSPRPGC